MHPQGHSAAAPVRMGSGSCALPRRLSTSFSNLDASFRTASSAATLRGTASCSPTAGTGTRPRPWRQAKDRGANPRIRLDQRPHKQACRRALDYGRKIRREHMTAKTTTKRLRNQTSQVSCVFAAHSSAGAGGLVFWHRLTEPSGASPVPFRSHSAPIHAVALPRSILWSGGDPEPRTAD
jgi:hypothetical protein